MPVIVILVLVSIAFCVTLGILLFGSRSASSRLEIQQKLDAEAKARTSAEADLERRRKEVDEQRAQLLETREQLKQAKRKLFEQKESERGGRDLSRAREEIERRASLQLETVQAELGAALLEIQRLKTDEPARVRRPAAAPVAAPAPAPPPPPEKAPRQFRELSDSDRERIQRLEQQASRERTRAGELDRELKRLRGRTETQHRIYVVTKGELDLVKDKFKALEMRLNRTLLERDLLRRAMADLEKKTGIRADRTELTPEEIAASDRKVEEKAVAEAAAEAARAKAQEEDRDRAPDPEGPQPDAGQRIGTAS